MTAPVSPKTSINTMAGEARRLYRKVAAWTPPTGSVEAVQGTLPCLGCGGPPRPGSYSCKDCFDVMTVRVAGWLGETLRRWH